MTYLCVPCSFPQQTPVAPSQAQPSADTAPHDGGNFLVRVWRAYNNVLDHSPILTKSATSFFGFMCGDILAQKIVGDPFDIARMVRLVLFGIFMDGPVGELPS